MLWLIFDKILRFYLLDLIAFSYVLYIIVVNTCSILSFWSFIHVFCEKGGIFISLFLNMILDRVFSSQGFYCFSELINLNVNLEP